MNIAFCKIYFLILINNIFNFALVKMKTISILAFLVLARLIEANDLFQVKTIIDYQDLYLHINPNNFQVKLSHSSTDVFEFDESSNKLFCAGTNDIITYNKENCPYLMKFADESLSSVLGWSLDRQTLRFDHDLYFCGTKPPYSLLADPSGSANCRKLNIFRTVLEPKVEKEEEEEEYDGEEDDDDESLTEFESSTDFPTMTDESTEVEPSTTTESAISTTETSKDEESSTTVESTTTPKTTTTTSVDSVTTTSKSNESLTTTESNESSTTTESKDSSTTTDESTPESSTTETDKTETTIEEQEEESTTSSQSEETEGPSGGNVDSTVAMVISAMFQGDRVYFYSDDKYITLLNGDLATFKIDDGYLQVNNNKWVNVNIERLLELVDNQEDATQGWIINDEGIFLVQDGFYSDSVSFSACGHDSGYRVYLGEENGCEPLNQFRIMNIEEDEIDETETTESTKTTETTKTTGPAETTDLAESTDDLNESSAPPPTEDPSDIPSATTTDEATVDPSDEQSIAPTSEPNDESTESEEPNESVTVTGDTTTDTSEQGLTTFTTETTATVTDCEDGDDSCTPRTTIRSTVITTHCPIVTKTEVETIVTDLTITLTTCIDETICEATTLVVSTTVVTTTLTTHLVVTEYVLSAHEGDGSSTIANEDKHNDAIVTPQETVAPDTNSPDADQEQPDSVEPDNETTDAPINVEDDATALISDEDTTTSTITTLIYITQSGDQPIKTPVPIFDNAANLAGSISLSSGVLLLILMLI